MAGLPLEVRRHLLAAYDEVHNGVLENAWNKIIDSRFNANPICKNYGFDQGYAYYSTALKHASVEDIIEILTSIKTEREENVGRSI